MIYLDTSALVKRYVEEKGSVVIGDIFNAGQRLLTSRVAYAESLAAFFRRWREGGILKEDLNSICQRFEWEWDARFDIIGLTDAVSRHIRELIGKYPLRGFDAIHLASALLIKDRIDEESTFVCSDRNLLDAAGKEGFKTLNPEQCSLA
ncbi:MAG: type II toxin-antitoxin system VapC family toxin [Dehalococcoidia bacterium]